MPPKRRKPFKNQLNINVSCFFGMSLPMAIRSLYMAPKWPQERPKRAPIRFQESLRAPQEAIVGALEGRR